MERLEWCERDWDRVAFVTLARNFGFGINSDAMESWAKSLSMSAMGKHRDLLEQIESLFFGQAGLLDDDAILSHYKADAATDDYLALLRREYRFLKQKFMLTGVSPRLWRFMRLRPQNFPHIRIAQLAMMWHQQQIGLSKFVNVHSREELHQLLQTTVSDYWQHHYAFASTPSPKAERHLTSASLDLILINSIVPLIFAYGRYKADETMCERAISLMEQIPPENNTVIRQWHQAEVKCQSAADSQALMLLTKKYCNPRDCLRCRFGYEYIHQTPDFLNESEQ